MILKQQDIKYEVITTKNKDGSKKIYADGEKK